ncbi:response regulator transcription factor [Nitrospiraceae bacterium HYJII51-Mn-bac16s-1-B09]|uniref:Response regulator transcription factor n=1 Tax=Candidatus Manganitrophus noduliformans TaxID=2606439 RepID=A0A7X6DND7_9BACT|nr:response regulator transcription factor [Candidatus Manganitrophus noduliformans]
MLKGAKVNERKKLTKREKEVLCLVAEGHTNRQVAERLGIKIKTVETHRANIMNKLALRNFVELVKYAIRKGMIKLEEDT